MGTKTLKEITQINEDGFGDSSNRYAFAMESFKGKLYVGTSHIKRSIPGIYQFAAGSPLSTDGAQLFAYDDKNVKWSNYSVFLLINYLTIGNLGNNTQKWIYR